MKFAKVIRSFFLAATVALASPAFAEQGTIVGPTTGPHTMADVMTTLNAALLAIQTKNSGSSAPANGPLGLAVHYQFWCDTTSLTPAVCKIYDGTTWVNFGKLDSTGHIWTPTYQGTDTGTASTATTGTSGHTLGFLDGANAWSGVQTLADGKLVVAGLTSGSSTIKAPATGGGTATLFPGTDTVVGAAVAQTLTTKTINCANNTCTVRLGSDVTGTLLAANFPTLTGDVTTPGASLTTTLVNIPSGVPAVGFILHTNIAAPSTPAAGKVSIWTDSTDLRFHDKNSAGTIGTTVVADTGAANNFLTAISAAGVPSKARPACANLSDAGVFCSGTSAANLTGTLAAGQFPALTGDVTTSAGSLATAIGATKVTSAMLNSDVFSTVHSWGGVQTFAAPVTTGVFDIQGTEKWSSFVTSTALAADTNDYTATDGSNTCTTKLTLKVSSTTSSHNVTGLSCSQAEGDIRQIHNVGTQNVVLTNQDALSTTTNRFLFGGDVTLLPNYSITIRYDNTAQRWRALTTASAGGGGGVTSVIIAAGSALAVSGTCTITTSGTCTVDLSAARKTTPTISLVKSGSHSGGFGANGSGTYTTPANVLWIRIRMVGGGGGGGGGATSGSPTDGGAGSATTFSGGSLSAGGASGGGRAGSAVGGGAGGTSSGGSIANLTGNGGGSGAPPQTSANGLSGSGGGSVFGGGGQGISGASAGVAGAADTGGGASGGGGASSPVTGGGGQGGGGGGYVEHVIAAPAATYTYAVGGGGTAGAAGTNGGAGASGQIIVEEHYGSWLMIALGGFGMRRRRRSTIANDNLEAGEKAA